jgi:site-specific recombinase
MGDAFRLLALRVEGQARERGLRTLLPSVPVEESAFRLLSAAGERLVKLWQGGEERGDAVGEWRRRHGDALAALETMHASLSARGVSLDAVYGMAIIHRCLIRMEALVRVMEAPDGAPSGAALHALLAGVAGSVAEDHRVRDLLRWNLRLLDMKIVERSGKIGEHYVAGDRAEYRGIWKAAAAGGLLTTGTAAVKLTITSLGLPLFQEGLLAGINYAVSFLILHRFGWILATKQPAMTAAALAAIVREHRGEDRINELVEFAARIAHSQLAAAVGNVVMVTIGAYALDIIWTFALGRDFLSADKAGHVFSMLNPFLGATMLYAALTGVILWMASLAGGWFENFSLYNRVPQGIAAHPAGRLLGRARLTRFAASWRTNIAGWATNVSLGFMLGMAPVVGSFLGLPFDVRHVTLSTGMFALAAAAVDLDLLVLGRLIPALLGIGLMFTLNLSVSFILSLFNAAFAYGLTLDEFGEILRLLVLRFLRHPRDFFLPPRESNRRLTLNA